MNEETKIATPLIEIHGDVWLLSDIVCIALDEPADDEQWAISIKLRGWHEEDWEVYDMDTKAQAQEKHVELLQAWGRWLAS